MPNETAKPGAETAGIPQAQHDAAVTAARTAGVSEGVRMGTDRLSAALGAEGVKGDAGRMAAALDLAVKSPAMSGADVATFVVANVVAGKPADAADYEERRLAGAGLAAPRSAAPEGAAASQGWAKTAASINKRQG